MTENMKGREEEKRGSIVGENLVYSILAKELIVAKKGVDERTTDGDRASSLFHHFSPKITESFPARLKYPTLVSSLSIILSQLNDFNRSLKSSQAPGPLVNCSSAALLRYHYVRNNFDVEWDTCFVSIADDATIIEKEKRKRKREITIDAYEIGNNRSRNKRETLEITEIHERREYDSPSTPFRFFTTLLFRAPCRKIDASRKRSRVRIQSKRIYTAQMFGSLRSMARESGYDRDKR